MKKFCMSLIVVLCLSWSHIFAYGPILFCAIEKSASCYIAAKLRKGLQMPLTFISNKDERPAWYIEHLRFAAFVNSNSLAREHLIPSQQNIALIKNSGIKMVFHVRDLRQRVVSYAFYHQQLVKENPSIAKKYRDQGHDIDNWTLDDYIEYFITGIPNVVQTIQGWLNVYHKGTIPILLTTFEEFHDNEELFFDKILDFYNIPKYLFNPGHIPKNRPVKFRKGTKDEWRSILTLDQQKRVNDMIPDEFFPFFNWEH